MDLLLTYFDIPLLQYLNVDIASPGLDQFWLTITHLERHFWFVYIVLPLILGGLFYIYRWSTLRLLIAMAVAVSVADLISYRVVKHMVDRQRPFQNSELTWVRHVGDAQGNSFPSNHAANCFAGASVLAWYFRSRRHYFYIFAGLVAASRVALGVHYPSDVIAGMIIGLIVGYLVRIFLLHNGQRLWLVKHGSTSDTLSGNWRTRTRRLEDV